MIPSNYKNGPQKENKNEVDKMTENFDKMMMKQSVAKDVMNTSQGSTLNDKKTPNYQVEKIIGKGTFGVVYMARLTDTGKMVAIKKVFQDKRYKNRELQIIKELNHPNCINLKYAFYTQEKADEVYLNIMMDYMPEDLYRLLKFYRKQKQQFPNVLVKMYSYQMLRSIAYIHAIGICHRDIKPQNMLVDPSSHNLKLCDFGSAKKLIKGEPNVAYICSRYYRAPELIFGATDYNCTIDVWSIGCVMAELLLGEPLFPGESGVDQLVEIIKILGTPSIEQVKVMNPNYKEFKFPVVKAHPWSKVFKTKVDQQAVDLISKLLIYSPKERLTPFEAMLHPFFNDLRSQNFKINNHTLPELFNFTDEEINSCPPEILEKLIPSWYKK